MIRRLVPVALTLLAATGLIAATALPAWYFGRTETSQSPDFAEARAACLRVEHRRPPATDLPTPAEARALKGCSSEALYYGIGVRADPVQARKCAFVEMQASRSETEPFAGPGLLMMVYANGRGARRDLDLAVHMACALNTAPVDNDTLVKALVARKTGGARSDFDYCRDVNQGYSNVSIPDCVGHASRLAAPARDAKRRAAEARLPPAARAAYRQLLERERRFIEARISGEHRSAALYRGEADQFRNEILDADVALLAQLAAGRGPRATAAIRRGAERRVDQAFEAFQAALRNGLDEDGITAQGLAQSQAAWADYRDAWLRLVMAAWPTASVDGVAARLAGQRTRALRCGELGEADTDDAELEKLCRG